MEKMAGRCVGLWLIGWSLAGPVAAQPGERPSIFKPPPPSIASLTPASGGVGTAVTIAGIYFWSSQGSNTVTFNGTNAGTASSWSDGSITVNVPNGATTGNVVVTAAGVASNGMPFAVIPAPTLTSVSPASGVQGTSVPVTLAGANFMAGATVAVSNSGITAGSVTVVSATQITATLTIGASAAAGAANVTVTTSGGTSGSAVFTVKPPAPVLTSVSPASGVQGTSVPVTLTGANFVTGAMVMMSRGGITVSNLTVVSATQITATLTIAVSAAPGAVNFAVATSGGASSAVSFTVNPPAPTLTSVSPASGVQGTSVPVTLTGTNFVAGASVAVGNPGITAGSVTAVSATQITVTLTIGGNAATGAANVTVTTSGGTSGPAAFTVNPPAPTLTSVSPASGVQGTSVPVTLTGANFVAGATVAVSDPGITASGVTVVSATQITATLAIGASAATGAANVTVTTSGGTSGPAVFTVNPPAPTLTSVSPASGLQGISVPVTLTGANFVAGATVAVSNPGITVGSVTVVSATQITATLTIGASAATGVANVTVTTSGGTSGPAVFTVNLPAPVLVSVSPASGLQGTSVPVTLMGGVFVAGATVAVSNPGIAVGSVTVVSSTQITATLTIGATAATGAANVTVTTSGGTSSAVVFTVNPSAPTLTSVSPASGVQGTSVPVTLMGGVFVAGATVAVSNPGIAVGSVTVVSATQITATLTIGANAATGAANVTVTTSGGTSGPAAFTVNPPAPTLTSVSPASGVQGTSVPVTLTGSNLVEGATVAVSNPGITVGGVTVVSSTQITATLTIDASAATGATNVTVTTSGGTSGPAAFTVNPPAPTLTSVSPASGVQGTSVPVILTGANFIAGATVAVGNSGIAVGSLTVVSATQITATLTIGASAATGAANITVTTSGGTSGPAAFTVNPPAPVLTSVSPASGVQGTSVPVTLAGTNFVAGATVAVGNSGVAVSAVSLVSATQITATFTIAANAALGAANVTVTTSAGTSNAVSFTVTPAPSITSVSPTTAVAGTQVTISGLGFGSARGTGTVLLGSTYGSVVSWSDTQIVATVASNAQSGGAVVQQNGLWSNWVPFTVITPTILTLTPAIGAPGDSVTIAGSGFGASQGTGQVWLGTATGVVQSWSDTQIVAQVGAGAASGNAQVLQNNVMSNAVPFTVNTPQIASIDPNSGVAGAQVTFAGTGFGANPGVAWLGSMAGQVVSWTDAQVVATVAAGAVSGVAKIQRSDGLWSNALGFTVPAPGSNTVMPSLLNMVVGDTRTLQALSAGGQTVMGLTWTSSNPAVVSLSTDDPPVLTAVAAGHVTITAGTGSADVTVWAGALPVGTTIWSNPGNGSGVSWIVPAVPSATGVADVFAIQNDGTVQAITSDGTVAWTADVSQAYVGSWFKNFIPDFQGGLVIQGNGGNRNPWIEKLDGVTGAPYPKCYLGPSAAILQTEGGTSPYVAAHPDGTVFAVVESTVWPGPVSVVGIDPTTGTQKFSVPLPQDACAAHYFCGLIIAGDGYAYVVYEAIAADPGAYYIDASVMLLRIGTDGSYDRIHVYDWVYAGDDYAWNTPYDAGMITNADTGILLTWMMSDGSGWMGVTAGTSASLVGAPGGTFVTPVLQAQDGSFFGAPGIKAFDASGNVRWVVPNDDPAIATADGGVIGTSGIAYDANGNATGTVGSLPTLSWAGNSYTDGQVTLIQSPVPNVSTTSFAAFQGGNESHTSVAHRTCALTSDWTGGRDSGGPWDNVPTVTTKTIQGIFSDARVNFQWGSSNPKSNPNMHAVFSYILPPDILGQDPNLGNTIQIDTDKINYMGTQLHAAVQGIQQAIGVVSTHEFGHFLLQQQHCSSQSTSSACLQGKGIMRFGEDQGDQIFHQDLGGNLLFMSDQKPVIQKRCSELTKK